MFNVSRVLIVGAGFAGMNCAKVLAGKPGFAVTLMDRHNSHQFQPLLYQVAVGALSPQNAAFNLRVEFSDYENVEVRTAEIVQVDLSACAVIDNKGNRYEADYLVLAAGNEANFFGVKGAEEYALPIYSLKDAERLRSRLLALIEDAGDEPTSQATNLSIVVVGGGPTGVEVAGAIQDLLRLTPKHVFPDFDLESIKVTLINNGPSLLAPFTSMSQQYAIDTLRQRGVNVLLGSAVTEVTKESVVLSNGTTLPANLVIWAGGLKASALAKQLGVEPGRGGRIAVNDDLTIPGYPRVYALGDFANAQDGQGGYLAQLAAVAQQAGRYCGHSIIAAAQREEQEPFSYHDKGILAMIGRNAAISELGTHHHPINGPFAFITWLGVHAALLANLRAETEAIFEWSFDYARGIPMNPLRLDDVDTLK